MTKGDIAKENFLSGLNCAQAVLLAFKDEIGQSEELLKKASIAFGGGFARLRLTCGAVSGMAMAISLLVSDGSDKTQVYLIVQEAVEKFKKEVGGIICAELLEGKIKVDTNPIPEKRTEEYYKKRPCAELCKIAGDIVEDVVLKNM